MIRTLESVETPTPTTVAAERSDATVVPTVSKSPQTAIPPISPPPTNLGPDGLDATARTGYFNLPVSPSISDSASQQGSVPTPSVLAIEPLPSELDQSELHLIKMSQLQVRDRIPIFAVSAGLDQHSQESLENAGFDGWLSKPIDFKKLGLIMEGVMSRDARALAKSIAGDYVGGGWFN
jgi:hypothetical protein